MLIDCFILVKRLLTLYQLLECTVTHVPVKSIDIIYVDLRLFIQQYYIYKNSVLKLHHELPLSGMEIQLPPQDADRNELYQFNVLTTIRSLTLSAKSIEMRNECALTICAAIGQFQSNQSSITLASTIPEVKTVIRLGKKVWATLSLINSINLISNINCILRLLFLSLITLWAIANNVLLLLL